MRTRRAAAVQAAERGERRVGVGRAADHVEGEVRATACGRAQGCDIGGEVAGQRHGGDARTRECGEGVGVAARGDDAARAHGEIELDGG